MNGDCILCELPDTDAIDDYGQPAHLSCLRSQACEQLGHQHYDNGRCYCGKVEHVETKGMML